MISPTDFPYSLTSNPELVFTHDSEGKYLSFFVGAGLRYCFTPDKIIDSYLSDVFCPDDVEAYIARIQQVLASKTAEQFSSQFWLGNRSFLLNLVMSPVYVPDSSPTSVIVMGHVKTASPSLLNASPLNASPLNAPPLNAPPLNAPPLNASPLNTVDWDEAIAGTDESPIMAISADRHHKLLTQIAWNIRRTLDLPTIWQQTVEGLGKVLGVGRCIVCPYEVNQPTVQVVAEYCQAGVCHMKGLELVVADDPDLSKAIVSLSPINIRQEGNAGALKNAPLTLRSLMKHSMLIVTTCYQDQPNGLIVLFQDDQPRRWTEVELEFVRELADQVGTAIAHANLIAASQSLARELQQANTNLRQKHRELEDASRQAEEASRLKSEFLANTSHELRTPLNGIMGFLKLILDGLVDDPEEQSEFLNEAYRSAGHLNDVLNDILDIARIEAGRLQIELSPVRLSELLNDAERSTGSQARHKNLSFEIQRPPTNDEILLYGDYQRLKQVMLNLLSNAIKFTDEGGITISVEIIKRRVMVQDREMPGLAKIRVADTGIGVSLDQQDRLFQSFSQVDGSRTRQYPGTGLGLAISQKLIEAMGGVVNFYSMGEGLGSTVTFTVPLYQEPLMITTQLGDFSEASPSLGN